jgi:hypothetical protein
LGGGNVTSIFCIPSKPYTFSVAFSSSSRFSKHSAEKIQQQILNIQQRRSSSRFRTFSREDPAADSEHSEKIQQQIPNIQQKIQQQIPNIQQKDPAADSEHSAEDPAADLAADAATIKIHFFDLIHYFHNQVKKIMNRILQPHVHNSHPFLKG